MHHEPRGLVYHQEALVLENNRNGDVFGPKPLLDEEDLDTSPSSIMRRAALRLTPRRWATSLSRRWPTSSGATSKL
jgi:hypothetical protein